MTEEIIIKRKQKFTKALLHAINGMLHFITYERNGRIQFAIACAAILLGFLLNINMKENIVVLFCIAGVFATEMLNTAIEKLCDMLEPAYHPSIKIIKDISAGAVLVIAAASLVAGCFIFLPKLF